MKGMTVFVLYIFIGLFINATALVEDSVLAAEGKASYMFRGISCEAFKETLLHESLYVTFTEKPLFHKKSKCWALSWNGVHVLLPQTDFEHVYVKKNKNGRYELFLKTKEGLLVSVTSDENTVFNDIFAVTADGKNVESSADGVVSTTRMYGGPVTLSALMMAAYEHTPDQVTCCKENYDEDISVAIVMILKKMNRIELVAAYKGVGARAGWMTESKGKQLREYDLNILDATQERIFHLMYRLPEDDPYQDLPFRVGEAGAADSEDAPPWLEALNQALAYSSDDDWRRYAAIARQSGISEKSISKTLERVVVKPVP
ncbi:hypothetical protein [Desulfoluna sp.]|uniref:hypothetical protein n=1 Tax=Desulfoluna sp. TaxID=2045199 RepID=UPI0026367CDA|nr:hypothetical protein [Desulfoluna sp.]